MTHPLIEEALDQHDKKRQRIVAMWGTLAGADDVAAKLADYEATVSLSTLWATPDVEITLRVDDVGPAMVDVIRVMREFHFARRPESYRDGEWGNKNGGQVRRVFYHATLQQQIEVTLVLKETATCEFVEIGTKEVPVYELQCKEAVSA